MRLLPFLEDGGNTSDPNAAALHRDLTAKLTKQPAQISDLITLLREYTPELRNADRNPAGALQWLSGLQSKLRG